MSDRETLEEFTRRYDILVGVGGGLTATDKQVAAIRGVLEENERLRAGRDEAMTLAQKNHADHMDAEDRIDAALALHTEVFVGDGTGCVCGWSWSAGRCNSPTVRALKGEK